MANIYAANKKNLAAIKMQQEQAKLWDKLPAPPPQKFYVTTDSDGGSTWPHAPVQMPTWKELKEELIKPKPEVLDLNKEAKGAMPANAITSYEHYLQCRAEGKLIEGINHKEGYKAGLKHTNDDWNEEYYKELCETYFFTYSLDCTLVLYGWFMNPLTKEVRIWHGKAISEWKKEKETGDLFLGYLEFFKLPNGATIV